jgi:hypothetical protein
MTVCWLTAAPTDVASSAGGSNGAALQASQTPAAHVEEAPKALGFRDRMRKAFGWPPLTQAPPATQAHPAGAPQKAQVMHAGFATSTMQGSSVAAPPAVKQATYTVYHPSTITPATVVDVKEEPASINDVVPSRLQIEAKNAEKVGHETDYSWVTGYLSYLHTDGGRWVLRYTGVDEIDPFGGSVVLTPTVDMKNYREGDLVSVTGGLLNEGQAARPLGGAMYRVNSIQMIERADQ